MLPDLHTWYNPRAVRITGGSIAGATLVGDEGTFTPVLTFATPGDLAVAYSVQQGHYTRSGTTMTVWFNVVTSSFTHTTASGLLLVTGLPFTSNATFVCYGEVSWGGITKATPDIKCRVVANVTNIRFIGSVTGGAPSEVVATDVPTGGSVVLRGQITYRTV